ncbi:hypothetical protein TorRG33x02_305090 [Trema orientale]|uniref:Uncharacterized protein n=1 Tax=Trema orientale TaxID=63057 RepID=A0A2P5BXM1_TREOI|nr:hypothetical protein TorRG33x02_305090 [Trema orientale]
MGDLDSRQRLHRFLSGPVTRHGILTPELGSVEVPTEPFSVGLDLLQHLNHKGCCGRLAMVLPTMDVLGYKELFSFHKKEISDSSAPLVNPMAVEERLNMCKFFLIGLVILSNGDKPWSLTDLKARLDSIWKISSWRLISLGKGYFLIMLTFEKDKTRVWSMGSLNIKPGILRLWPWVPGFVLSEQKTTNIQVWVRFYELPWEFWYPQILSDLARAIGCPLKIDQATLNGDFSHSARALVDVDLKNPLLDSI